MNSLVITEDQLARLLQVERQVACIVDQAGQALNRDAFAMFAVLDVVLEVLGVPPGDWRPPLWETYFSEVSPVLAACREYVAHVRAFVESDIAGGSDL